MTVDLYRRDPVGVSNIEAARSFFNGTCFLLRSHLLSWLLSPADTRAFYEVFYSAEPGGLMYSGVKEATSEPLREVTVSPRISDSIAKSSGIFVFGEAQLVFESSG